MVLMMTMITFDPMPMIAPYQSLVFDLDQDTCDDLAEGSFDPSNDGVDMITMAMRCRR